MRPYTDASEHLADQLAAVRVALRLAARRRGGADDAELARLAAHRARIEDESAARAAVSELAAVPLERLRRTFRLSSTECGVLVLLTAIEVDVRLHGLAVALMQDAARGHVDVGPREERQHLVALLQQSAATEDEAMAIAARADAAVAQTRASGFGERAGNIQPETHSLALPLRMGAKLVGTLGITYFARTHVDVAALKNELRASVDACAKAVEPRTGIRNPQPPE